MGKKKVIVVGGGFAGLQFIEYLDATLFDVLLIDKLNYHQFQPLFYQVATSQIEPSSISFPFRRILQNRSHVHIRLAEVLHVQVENQIVSTTIGDFSYDFLVIATGCRTNFFNNAQIQAHAFTLKTTYQAITIRNKILENFERIVAKGEQVAEELLHIVIVGGGPTGVELAGAFAEIRKDILPKDFPDVDFSRLKVILVEGTEHTLNNMSPASRKASRFYLEQLGVQVKTSAFVTSYDGKTITLNTGETILSNYLIWAAGVIGNKVDGFLPEDYVRGNRYIVDRTNKLVNHSSVYAIGDISYMETPKFPKGHPQVANVAINQGRNLARNLKAIIHGKKQKEYDYKDLGSMATVGRHKAVVDFPFVSLKGYFAWYIWMFIHLMLILSVRNKLIIFINWAWNYFSKDTSLRLILKGDGIHEDTY